MMLAPAYCSHCYHIDYLQIGSLHSTGIYLRDLCVFFSPHLQFILAIPSAVKGRGTVREYVCSCADTWAVMGI